MVATILHGGGTLWHTLELFGIMFPTRQQQHRSYPACAGLSARKLDQRARVRKNGGLLMCEYAYISCLRRNSRKRTQPAFERMAGFLGGRRAAPGISYSRLHCLLRLSRDERIVKPPLGLRLLSRMVDSPQDGDTELA